MRPFHDLLEKFSFRIARRLSHYHKFTRRLAVWTEFLNAHGSPVGVIGPREQIVLLFVREALNDFGFGERGRRFRLSIAGNTCDVALRRRRDRPLRRILAAGRKSRKEKPDSKDYDAQNRQAACTGRGWTDKVHRILDAPNSPQGSLPI